MEILVIVVAFWLVLVGAYGGLSLMTSSNKGRAQRTAAPPARANSPAPRQQPLPGMRGDARLGGLHSEVDMLRAQVEHLRTELSALSDVAARHERPRMRRYRTGVYADLPRMLRRQVKEARDFRHPLSV